MSENPYESPPPQEVAHEPQASASNSNSGIAVLFGLSVVSAILWLLYETNPIFVFGVAAVVWIFVLMLVGAFSKPYQPFNDDAESQRGLHGPPGS